MLFYIRPDVLASDLTDVFIEALQLGHGNKAGHDPYPGDLLEEIGFHHKAHDHGQIIQDDLIAGIPKLIAGNLLSRTDGGPYSG